MPIKIGALVLAGMLVLGMAISSFAAVDMDSSGVKITTDNGITLKKAIQITNYNDYTYEPTITYTYTLSDGPDTPGTVTFGSGNDAVTHHYKQGKVSYLASGCTAAQTAVFSSSNQVTAAAGGKSVKNMTWSFAPAVFPSAGIYRFIITETTDKTPANIGIVRDANYDTSKFFELCTASPKSI